MNIAIDIRALQQRWGGVPEYTRQVVRALIDTETTHRYLLYSNSATGDVGIDLEKEGPHHVVCKTRIPNKLLHSSLIVAKWPGIDALIEHATGIRPDLLFFPNTHFLAHDRSIPRIVTVHDLSYEHAPDLFSGKSRVWHVLTHPRDVIAEAAHVIAVSEWTRRDVIASYRIPSERVSVTPLSASASCVGDVRDRSNRKRVILFDAGNSRKNADVVVQAWMALRVSGALDPAHTLVLTGRWTHTLRQALAHHVDDSIVFCQPIDDQEREQFYREAAALLYPSIHEGFGIPLLEAAHAGVPIITAQHTSIG
ncbi:MAG: glycosyltransferase family 1 protein [Patescibacteria group bacterium]